MRKYLYLIVSGIIMFLYGCELTTEKGDDVPQLPKGNDLVINEVFTISPDKFYSYSWVEILNPTDSRIKWFDIQYPASAWVVGGNGDVPQTTNSGRDWSHFNTTLPTIYDVGFRDLQTLFAVGEYQNGSSLFTTTNAGSTWSSVTGVPTTKTMRGIEVGTVFNIVNSRVIWMCGDSGQIIRTTNLGTAWSKSTNVTTQTLRAITLTTPSVITKLFCVGDSVILRSSNVGRDWVSLNKPRIEKFYDIAFCNDTTAIVVGENGIIMATPDTVGKQGNGNSWRVDTSNVKATLRGVAYLNNGRAWVVGDSGYILATTNSGIRWSKQNSGVGSRLNSVKFVDDTHGWVFGDNGVILATTDGGIVWRKQQSGTTNNYNSAIFLPLFSQEQSFYALRMYSQRKRVYWNPPFEQPNADYITKVDTGNIYYIPLDFNNGQADTSISFSPGGFVVINSDSGRFQDHIGTGPSNTKVVNRDLALEYDELIRRRNGDFAMAFIDIPQCIGDSIFLGSTCGTHLVKWNLLPSSEIRLVKIFVRVNLGANQITSVESKTVDVVRWGGFTGTDYPNNKAIGYFPREGYSLARYADIMVYDVNTFSTASSFYFSDTPIPGWISQRRKNN